MSGTKNDNVTALDRARLALDGLSVGDAFGQQFFVPPHVAEEQIAQRRLPPTPWGWTDDTAMALAIVETLKQCGEIERDVLAAAFADGYVSDWRRGYGGTAHGILQAIAQGQPWRTVSAAVFDGGGSMGNGSAMRVAPVGAYFADDLDAVVEQAARSAEPTHAHEDGRAGAIAVALAAALAWRIGSGSSSMSGQELLQEVTLKTPAGPTRDGMVRACNVSLSSNPASVAAMLGNGSRVICSDTVPFSLWCAARHLHDFTEAMWATVSGLGDRDTTCAIAGGVVALSASKHGIPQAWMDAREPLGWPIPLGTRGT